MTVNVRVLCRKCGPADTAKQKGRHTYFEKQVPRPAFYCLTCGARVRRVKGERIEGQASG